MQVNKFINFIFTEPTRDKPPFFLSLSRSRDSVKANWNLTSNNSCTWNLANDSKSFCFIMQSSIERKDFAVVMMTKIHGKSKGPRFEK